MDALVDLGFGISEAAVALNQCNGDVEAAANLLFSLTPEERQGLVTTSATTATTTIAGTSSSADGPCKMVLCVREDLNMTVGKVCAQCCHAAVALCEEALVGKFFRWKQSWAARGATKIVVAVPDEPTLLVLAESAHALQLPFHIVQDAGRTEVSSGTRTVLGIGPAPSSIVDQVTGNLSLL